MLPACAEKLADLVVAGGASMTCRKAYAGLGHGCTREELADLRAFIAAALPPTPKAAALKAAAAPKAAAASAGAARAAKPKKE